MTFAAYAGVAVQGWTGSLLLAAAAAVVATGAVLLTLFLEGSCFLRDVLPLVSEVQMASLRIGAIGFAMIVFTMCRPQGLPGRSTR